MSLITGGIGFVLFVYGKKQQRWPQLAAGVAFMVYPALTDQLAGLGRVSDIRFDRRQLERDLYIKLDDWRGLLRSEVQQARPILRLLVP